MNTNEAANQSMSKNRNREAPSFANINLLGRCNVDCFFCLGKDIEKELEPHNQLKVHFKEWKDFDHFLSICERANINKLYITGQNTDSLLYVYLVDLVDYLHNLGFKVGLRTNGYAALDHMDVINRCELSTGYSIQSLNWRNNVAIMGRKEMPNWDEILKKTQRPRVSVVLNRYNEFELMPILRFLENYSWVRYVQVRRVSTDTRFSELRPDIEAYERVWKAVDYCFGPPIKTLWSDADVYNIYGHEVVFWRTVKTSVNSWNYFTDGTISREYFIVEGYLNNQGHGSHDNI